MTRCCKFKIVLALFCTGIFVSFCCKNRCHYEEHTTENGLFSFQYPEKWQIDEVNELTVIVVEPERSHYRARFSLIVQFNPQPMRAKTYLDISVNQLKEIYADFALMGIDSTTLAGSKAYTLDAQYTEKGKRLRGYSAFLVQDECAFVFSGMALQKEWSYVKGIFDRAISTLTINHHTVAPSRALTASWK